MGIPITDENGITNLHVADKLEIDLAPAKEQVKSMKVKIYFKIFTVLPNGKIIGEPYFDHAKPLEFTCENNPDLESAMLLIQQTIGRKRYEQLTTPVEIPFGGGEQEPI